MGIYADNTYNLTIPVESIKDILDNWPRESWQGRLERTPEGIVQAIAQEFGYEGELPEFTDEDGMVHIVGWSSGKIGEPDILSDILAAHGVTGIVHGECEGELFLVEFTAGEVKNHGGKIVYPSYTGNLYE